MTWAKLDDAFFVNHKVQSIGPMATLLDVAAICFCAQSENDGHFRSSSVPMIASMAKVSSPAKHVTELIAAGLWDKEEGGYCVHDYLQYNPSHEHLEAERKRKREWKSGRQSSSASGRRSTGQSTGASVDGPVATSRPVPSSLFGSSLPEADPEKSNGCAKIRPREAHELILCLKIAVEREQPERGVWNAEPFGHKNAQEFLRGFGDDLEAALATIEQRIDLFAQDPTMRPWTVRKFADQYNAIGLPKQAQAGRRQPSTPSLATALADEEPR